MDAKYEGTFRWGRSGEANVPVELTRNKHGWFCASVNGQRWVYPAPTDPWGGWGVQVAKLTALEAVRAFLRQWDSEGDAGSEPGTIATAADRLTVREVVEV